MNSATISNFKSHFKDEAFADEFIKSRKAYMVQQRKANKILGIAGRSFLPITMDACLLYYNNFNDTSSLTGCIFKWNTANPESIIEEYVDTAEKVFSRFIREYPEFEDSINGLSNHDKVRLYDSAYSIIIEMLIRKGVDEATFHDNLKAVKERKRIKYSDNGATLDYIASITDRADKNKIKQYSDAYKKCYNRFKFYYKKGEFPYGFPFDSPLEFFGRKLSDNDSADEMISRMNTASRKEFSTADMWSNLLMGEAWKIINPDTWKTDFKKGRKNAQRN